MFIQDLRRALRIFRLEPGFTAAAVLTLALGIGANTALFAVVEAVLLRPLPVSGADELVILKHRDASTGITKEFIAIGDFIDFQARLKTVERVAAYGGDAVTLYSDNEPIRVAALSASAELLAVLRLQPVVGRTLGPDDMRPGAAPVVMISEDLWTTRFGSDPNILSRSIQLGNARRLIVGVAAKGFHFPPDSATEVIVPMILPATPPANRKAGWTFAVSRVRPGESIKRAQAEVAAVSQQFESEFPDQNRSSQYYLEPLREALVGDTKRPLLLLLAAVGFVLLIACANVGNLMIARLLAREQEMAVRTALGAARSRLASQVLTEALVLALVGGAIGVVLAWQAAPALAALVPQTTRVPGLRDVGINLPVLAFSLSTSIAAALLFSGLSFLSMTSEHHRTALAARGTTMSVGARRTAQWLVIGEVTLAGILLLGAGLTLRSFGNLVSVDPGFRIANVLTVQVAIPAARYATSRARADFFATAIRTLDALPEVGHSGAAVVTPLTGNNWTAPFERVDRPVPAGERPPDVGWQAAFGGFFSTLEIPLRAGRLFNERDAASTTAPVIISEEIARRFFRNENPIGRRLRTGPKSEAEIVGVVGDIRRAALSDQPRADMYFAAERGADTAIKFFIQTGGDPMAALPAVKTALRTLEPSVAIYVPRPLEDVAISSAAVARLAMRLFSGFAIVALVLAAIGIYGVMAYSVRRRTREIGTRVALGAERRDIIRLVMREGGLIIGAGVVAGLAIGLLAARSLSAVLYGVPPTDPLSLVASGSMLLATGMAACYIPARRAARVDPARTLTVE